MDLYTLKIYYTKQTRTHTQRVSWCCVRACTISSKLNCVDNADGLNDVANDGDGDEYGAVFSYMSNMFERSARYGLYVRVCALMLIRIGV